MMTRLRLWLAQRLVPVGYHVHRDPPKRGCRLRAETIHAAPAAPRIENCRMDVGFRFGDDMGHR